jgi:predicted nucleic acid-binding protein
MPSTSTAHYETARQIVSQGGIVSVQVLNEFVQVCRRKARMDWDEIVAALGAIESLCGRAVPLTMEIHRSAVELSRRYGFQIYDALILAAAQQAGCATVYSEDMQHGQQVGALKIVNPFLSTAD